MGKDEVSVKKRRKLNTSVSTDSSKQSPGDVYKRVVDFEEAEALSRPADKDANLFKKICQDIRQLFSDIAELKEKNSDEAKEKINSKRVEASLLLVALKKLNRLEKVRTRAGRDSLHKVKQQVDSTHLQLQNLLYEADHLNKEVTKCLQFKSKDEEIELVPVDDFYKEAPPEVSRPEVTKKDEHQLQLARLEWELRQRRELAGACNELVASKERVGAAIAAARSRLDALGPHLNDVLKATKPLQECMALRLDEKRDESRAAALLPPPLFLLYANASAYSDALGVKTVTVGISGDEDEAKRLDQEKNADNSLVLSNDSDSDQENNDDEQREKKKRHHRTAKVSKEEKTEAKKKEVLKKHPLYVQVSVKVQDSTALNLVFSYLLHLKIVVVKFTVSLPKPVSGVSAADVLNGHCILNELYPGDAGHDSPHPATSFLLKAAGVSEDFHHFISEVGRPYIWAQRMCGLDFMALVVDDQKKTNKVIQPCPSLSVSTVENFILTLKKRLKSRVALMKELQELESGKIVPAKGSPVRLSGSLTQWQSIGWPEYSQAPSTSFLISEGLVNGNDLLYRAIITRQSAKLIALVVLKSDYPKSAPIFSLTLFWNGTHHAGIDDDIRDIERIINSDWSSEDKPSLTTQMTKLLTCLDILLETTGTSEFPPDKVMFQPVRGRNRAKPYKFIKQGNGIFVQY
ncbi:THO complex subunit 5 homolog isoform X2 [Leguminivora glycinivorella]|uniref:THO complex subunit 5 homolog isoform X1 n=1 Tax=Leguminivora glycinivorella TaxID=1035111 RepID=UPI0020106CDD|nr:THO complex subunit 5 homolog isoform X1 [Leguminivora glycinivorella]XP_047990977.1 THO complex subunit 5 homolog isoform X2 [Leguminivora glycinivorella]